MKATYTTLAPCLASAGKWTVVVSDTQGAFAITPDGRIRTWKFYSKKNHCARATVIVWRDLLSRIPSSLELQNARISLFQSGNKRVLHLRSVPGDKWARSRTPNGKHRFMRAYRKNRREARQMMIASLSLTAAGTGLVALAVMNNYSQKQPSPAPSPQPSSSHTSPASPSPQPSSSHTSPASPSPHNQVSSTPNETIPPSTTLPSPFLITTPPSPLFLTTTPPHSPKAIIPELKLSATPLADNIQSAINRQLLSYTPPNTLPNTLENASKLTPRPWFLELFGASEYQKMQNTRAQFSIDGTRLKSILNDRVFEMGEFTTPTVGMLVGFATQVQQTKPLRLCIIQGDVSKLQALEENCGAMFQVASQFNCLEFTMPSVLPEAGIAHYVGDRTQGPACAIGAAAGLLYRNYFVPMPNGSTGQSRDNQINNLAEIKAEFKEWFDDRGGYTVCGPKKLNRITKELKKMDKTALIHKLRLGLHLNTEVTSQFWGNDRNIRAEQRVSQLFGSACSVAYSGGSPEQWAPFASMILEACYLGTVAAALYNRAKYPNRPGSNKLFLTMVGGGVFGNEGKWIRAAMKSAFARYRNCGLEVYLVIYKGKGKSYRKELKEFMLT